MNAKASIARSIQYKNDYATAYLEMGYACLKLKEDEDAIKWYQKAIELEPKSHIGYNGIAEVYRDNKGIWTWPCHGTRKPYPSTIRNVRPIMAWAIA